MGLIPGLGRSPGEGNGNPLYSCLENSGDSGPWGCKELDVTEHLSTCKKYISDYLLSIHSPLRSPARVHALLSFLSDVDSLQGCAPGTFSASAQAGLLPPAKSQLLQWVLGTHVPFGI